MKEKIYTIPVTEAFMEDCECPMCVLEKKLEDEYISYFLGPSLMEPDSRVATNDRGFCRRHFELLYNRQENRLGLGLMLDTHLGEQNEKMNRLITGKVEGLKKSQVAGLMKSMAGRFSRSKADASKLVDDMIDFLSDLEGKCAVCGKLDYTMDRYIDVILYLWFKEQDFRRLFNGKKGFCLKHLRQLLKGVKKFLNAMEAAEFTGNLLKMQMENMTRIREEVNWFTQKFDYRNSNAPWGNSKDALPRGIQKLTGFSNLK